MKRWSDVFGAVGTVLSSLLSCVICPLCLPVYAGLLGIVGLDATEINRFFFPAMILFGVGTLGLMARQIHKHHGTWAPFKLACGAITGMIIATFLDVTFVLYGFLALFMGSVIWNKRSLMHKGRACC